MLWLVKSISTDMLFCFSNNILTHGSVFYVYSTQEREIQLLTTKVIIIIVVVIIILTIIVVVVVVVVIIIFILNSYTPYDHFSKRR